VYYLYLEIFFRPDSNIEQNNILMYDNRHITISAWCEVAILLCVLCSNTYAQSQKTRDIQRRIAQLLRENRFCVRWRTDSAPCKAYLLHTLLLYLLSNVNTSKNDDLYKIIGIFNMQTPAGIYTLHISLLNLFISIHSIYAIFC